MSSPRSLSPTATTRPGPPASPVGERALSPSRSDVAGLDALAVVGGTRGG